MFGDLERGPQCPQCKIIAIKLLKYEFAGNDYETCRHCKKKNILEFKKIVEDMNKLDMR